MLSHVEITARVTVTEAAHFGWSNKVEYSHDCFVCRRAGRTVSLRHGAEHGVCHSSQAPLEWQTEQAGQAGQTEQAGQTGQTVQAAQAVQAGQTGQTEQIKQAGQAVQAGIRPGDHPAPIRVTGFDSAGDGADRTLRCRLSFWWSPFTDVERPAAQTGELGAGPWVRFYYRVGCHTCRDAGVDDWYGGEQSVQTNLVWPITRPCARCGTDLVTIGGPPEINLVG